MKQPNYRLTLLSLLAGGILPFAFAPIHFFLLAILSPALLLYSYLKSHTLKQLLLNGFLFAFAYFTVGVSWIYIAMHKFGQLNFLLSVIVTFSFIALLSTIFLLQAAIFYLARQQSVLCRSLLIFPASWVIGEWLRGWLLTGFPWLELGFSQDHSWLSAYLPIIGSYGVSFLLTLCAGLLAMIIINKQKYYIYLLAFIIIWLLGVSLSFINWTHPNGKTLSVSLVQGNISQAVKWNQDQIVPTLVEYQKLTRQHWNQLVIWPEGALPLLPQQLPYYLSQLSKEAKKNNSTVIFGAPTERQDQYFNSVIAIGRNSGQYDKRHLVPFGEYTPILLSFLAGSMDLPMASFSFGKLSQAPILINGIPIANFLCYEIAYAKLVRQELPRAQLLLNLSDDAWFGHSFAAAQQLQIAQVRAKQVGRYLLSVTNNGITAIVDANGHIRQRLSAFKKAVLTGKVPMMTGSTPWVAIGDKPIMLLMFLLLFISLLKAKIKISETKK